MRLLHLSDIHFRGQTRHAEYQKTIRDVLALQRGSLQADLLVLTGDIWHTKTHGISPESIDILSWFFRECSDAFLGVRVILGNHDGNLTNLNRQDVISPILGALNLPNVVLWKGSGTYQDPAFPTISWGVWSPFDKDGWKDVKPTPGGGVNIGLFHGCVQGAVTDSDWRLEHQEAELQHFRGKWDFVLLGDIHKRQILETRPDRDGADKPWIAYAGSLVQQNHGESEGKGGLIWDIRSREDWDLQDLNLTNHQPFLTTPWEGTPSGTLQRLVSDREVPPGSRVRISSQTALGFHDPKDLTRMLQRDLGVESVAFKTEQAPGGGDTIQGASTALLTHHSLRSDPDLLARMFGEWEDQVLGNRDPRGADLLKSYLERVNAQSRLEEGEQISRDVFWSPEVLRFDNTFRYGSGNFLRFKDLKGVNGIFGGNATGKSSVIGSLLYGLFGSTDRGPVKAANVINIAEKRCQVQVEFRVGQDLFQIERTTFRKESKKSKDESNSVLHLWSLDPLTRERVKSLNGDTGPETDKIIRKMIGQPDDFLMTAVSSQGDITRFVDRGATQRKAILGRFLDLDLFDRLFTLVKEDLNLKRSRLGAWSLDTTTKAVADLGDQIQGLEWDRKASEERRQTIQEELSGLSQKVIGDTQVLQVLEQNLVRKLETLTLEENNLKRFQEEEQKLLEVLGNLPTEESLQERAARAQKVSQEITDLNLRVKTEQTSLTSIRKKVRLLGEVPCGDQFPGCKFIKDSWEAASQEAPKEALVKTLGEELHVLQDALKTYGDVGKEVVLVQGHKKNLSKVSEQVMSLMEKTQRTSLEVEDLRGQVEDLKRSASPVLLARKEELEKKARFLSQEVVRIAESLGARKLKLSQAEKSLGENEPLLGEIQVLERVYQALGKNALPAMVLAQALPALNKELERILHGVVDFRVVLETDTGGSSNVMDVFLEDVLGKRPIEVGSGAEQMISALALRVALYNLSTLPKPDLFVIDEGFGVLDEVNLQRVTGFLQSLKNWFRVVLVISHVPEIKDAVDHSLDIGWDLGGGCPTLRG